METVFGNQPGGPPQPAVTVNFVPDGDWEVIGGGAAHEHIQNMATFQARVCKQTPSVKGA